MPDDDGRATPVERLTPRELEIGRLLMRGGRTATISSDLGISSSTVRAHLASIFGKLGLHSQADVVTWMRETYGGPGDLEAELDRLREVIEASNRRLIRDLRCGLEASDPLPRLREAVQAYLPLSPETRREWGARLRYWEAMAREGAPEGEQAPLREVVDQAERLAASGRSREVLGADVDPGEAVAELSRWIFGAAVSLLADDGPAAREAVMRQYDRLLEELPRRRA